MYLIPRNISKRFEFAPGYGWKEVIIISGGLLTGITLFFILKLLGTSAFPRFLLLFLTTAIGITITRPVQSDGSTVLDMLRYLLRYNKSQKLYLYIKRGL